MPRLLLIAAALLLAPITLSMANAPRFGAPTATSGAQPAPAADADHLPDADNRLTDAESRKLVAAALLVALEWGRR